MDTSTAVLSTQYSDVERREASLGDYISGEMCEGSAVHYPINTNSQQSSDGSEGDPSPDSTFSVPEHKLEFSRRSTPASSACDQECGEAEPCTSPCSPKLERETEQPPGQSPPVPSFLSRFLLPKRQHKSCFPQPTEGTQPTISQDAVFLTIPSEGKMYPFRGVPGLFVGFEDQVPPPPKQAQRFEAEIEPRFWTDASEFQQKLMKTKLGYRHPPGISLELRMSGYALGPHSTHVTLVPRIWVLYDHDRWKKEIKKFVRELEWLKHEAFGPVEIRKGSPKLATMNPPLFVEGLPMHPDQGFALSGDLCLYLHVEMRPETSAVGRLCCATVTKNGIVCGQRISRIGGMICIDSQRKLAITTAHGMLEVAWDALMELGPEMEDDTHSAESSPSYDYESDDSSNFDDTLWAGVTWPTTPATFKPQEVHRWESVEVLGVTSFLGSGSLDPESAILGIRDMVSQKQDTDFSLWGIPGANFQKNEYLPCNEPHQKVLLNDIPSLSVTQSMTPIGLNLLLSPEQSLEVRLLPGKSQFMVRGVCFSGRKVRTKAPLGPGCSGSWLAHGASLVGMLIASYENEPYAHFIPSNVLFNDVRLAIPGSMAVNVNMVASMDCLIPKESLSFNIQTMSVSSQTQQRGDNPTPVTHWEQPYSVGVDQRTNLTTPSQRKNQVVQSLTQIMLEESQCGSWPKTPLKMTVAKFNEVRTQLAGVSLAIEKISRALGIWYFYTNETARARKLIRFQLHVASQRKIPTQLSSLKEYPSITVEELKEGHNLLASIARDLAVKFPHFLRSNNIPAHPHQENHAAVHQAQPLVPLPNAIEGNRSQSSGSSSERKRQPSLEVNPVRKRIKYEPPPLDQTIEVFPGAIKKLPEETSLSLNSIQREIYGYTGAPMTSQPGAQKTAQTSTANQEKQAQALREQQVRAGSRAGHLPISPTQEVGKFQRKAFACPESDSDMHFTGFPTEKAQNAHVLEEHVRPNEDPLNASHHRQGQSPSRKSSTIDPQNLFGGIASIAPLNQICPPMLGDFGAYRSVTPNDTPESSMSKDSGVSEPNSEIWEAAALDIDLNWQPMESDLLLEMNNCSMNMEGLDLLESDFMGTESDFSKPFQFDWSLYSLNSSP